jgi:hypothetical protein
MEKTSLDAAHDRMVAYSYVLRGWPDLSSINNSACHQCGRPQCQREKIQILVDFTQKHASACQQQRLSSVRSPSPSVPARKDRRCGVETMEAGHSSLEKRFVDFTQKHVRLFDTCCGVERTFTIETTRQRTQTLLYSSRTRCCLETTRKLTQTFP